MTLNTDQLETVSKDKAEFDVRLEALMPSLLSYFIRRVTPREDAADCLSETMIILWRRQSSVPRDSDGFRSWGFGIAKNVLANQRRGQIRQMRLGDRLRNELAVDAPRAEEVSAEVEIALDALKSTDRELVTLVAWDGLGVAEAGTVLGLRPAAARARYSRARARLRAMLA